jgi:hypothetical protein
VIVGLMSVFEEAGRVGAAVESLFAAGCERVVVGDGAWVAADGRLFGGGESWLSRDGTVAEAVAAGAEVLEPASPVGSDGAKRDWLVRSCGASRGDMLLLLDADELVVCERPLELAELPSSHGCVIHRDLAGNDLPGLGGEWPRGDHGPCKPLLRWLRWSPGLRCLAPGRYTVNGQPIDAYLVQALGRVVSEEVGYFVPECVRHAYRLLRDREHELAPAEASLLPVLPGVEILHDSRPSPGRVEAKRRYYKAAA